MYIGLKISFVHNVFYNYHSLINTNILLLDTTFINNKYGCENITIIP